MNFTIVSKTHTYVLSSCWGKRETWNKMVKA
jgi:hypothetical protein